MAERTSPRLAIACIVFSTGCASVEMELVSLPGAQIRAQAAAPAPKPDPRIQSVAEAPPGPKGVQVGATKISFDEKIQFESWSAEIKPQSFALLDQIAEVLKENTKLLRVEVQGHTAKTGRARRSLELSNKRAAAVRDYLVKHGIAKQRLTARGFGEQQPIADNATAEGREKNRRVELSIVEQTQAVAVAQATAGTDDEED